MITSPFVHGFSRTSMLPHLFGNLILLLIVGRHLEQRVGSYRFLLVTICALLAYGFIQILANYDVNGASVFIWAYAPPCAVAAWGKRQHAESRTIGVLVVMWVLIPLAMTAVPFAYGFQGNILNAFLIANTFHISASLVGTVFAILWRKDLEKP